MFIYPWMGYFPSLWRWVDFVPAVYSLCSPSYVYVTVRLPKLLWGHREHPHFALQITFVTFETWTPSVHHFHSLSFSLQQLIKLLEFWCVSSSYSTTISYWIYYLCYLLMVSVSLYSHFLDFSVLLICYLSDGCFVYIIHKSVFEWWVCSIFPVFPPESALCFFVYCVSIHGNLSFKKRISKRL